MEKRKIIFDCDPGHDDIMAIMNALAHPEQLEILGYTTVCGNNTAFLYQSQEIQEDANATATRRGNARHVLFHTGGL